jgi:hypothetical protein
VYEESFSPTSLPTFVVGGVFDEAVLTGVRWNLSVVLIYISFMVIDGEYIFMCFLAIGFLLLKKFCLVQLPISLLVH